MPDFDRQLRLLLWDTDATLITSAGAGDKG
jgi:hypothetical protein